MPVAPSGLITQRIFFEDSIKHVHSYNFGPEIAVHPSVITRKEMPVRSVAKSIVALISLPWPTIDTDYLLIANTLDPTKLITLPIDLG